MKCSDLIHDTKRYLISITLTMRAAGKRKLVANPLTLTANPSIEYAICAFWKSSNRYYSGSSPPETSYRFPIYAILSEEYTKHPLLKDFETPFDIKVDLYKRHFSTYQYEKDLITILAVADGMWHGCTIDRTDWWEEDDGVSWEDRAWLLYAWLQYK